MTRSRPEGVVQDVEGALPWLLGVSPRDQSLRSAILSCAFAFEREVKKRGCAEKRVAPAALRMCSQQDACIQ